MSRKFGGFTSGIGVRYAPSVLINPTFQSASARVTVGERMPPHVFIRAADARPFELHDLLPADTRFRVLVFGGDVGNIAAHDALQRTADALAAPEGFLQRFGRERVNTPGEWEAFDVLCFGASRAEDVSYLGASHAVFFCRL